MMNQLIYRLPFLDFASVIQTDNQLIICNVPFIQAESLRTLMYEIASKLPKYPVNLALKKVGVSLVPQLIDKFVMFAISLTKVLLLLFPFWPLVLMNLETMNKIFQLKKIIFQTVEGFYFKTRKS